MSNESTIWLFLRKMRVPLIVLNLAHAIPVILLTLVPGTGDNGQPTHLSFFDAMYVVAYTATTIGFGEIPYAFSYAQRIVVFLTIYATVPAWIYALGSIIALLQEKTFTSAIKMNTFRRKVRHIGQDFIIVCGYTDAGKLLIDRLNKDNLYRIIVIDKNIEKIEALQSEMYLPSIPAIVADASMTDVLKSSGIESPHCKFLVTLFDDDQLNLKISVRARILNKKLRIIARSGIKQGGENLANIGVDHVIDAFSIIARRIDFAFLSPYLFNLLSWVQGGNLHVSKSDILPVGKYIVCSKGRFGKTLQKTLDNNHIEYTYLDINKETNEKVSSDQDFFIQAGIMDSACIIAGTNDDAINLSIIATARALNPKIFAIVRENELEERSLFSNLKVDKIFILDQIAALDGYNYIDRPMTFKFIDAIAEQNQEVFVDTLMLITSRVNKRPALIEMEIDELHMYALSRYLREFPVRLGQLINNPYRDDKDLEIVILGLERPSGEFILLPKADTLLQPNDRLLFATTRPSLEQFETIVNHYYELYYVIHGVEARRFKLPF
ncbi:potassium channel family protein [Sulfuricurvum sp.]|uniref:potassium channel family protein n=1 Tax=Sulfuricurvum sp. TaxID=2025608 RepID=UPI002616108D|nr:potassium channel protein [Sulfuricurvum sp.]MDD2267241.1 NAD-binding protein [Sulfuricurvum sp.]MDD2785060.1 NAD-binding protein [Sulfuricurvum sp.]HZF70123.1 NAD-binding protein [Sulfuricurvum sp.]